MTPIEKAINATGGQTKLAKALGVSPQLIHQIKKKGGKICTRSISPDQWKKATGLSKKELFPDYQD
ncbi:YdaS family helix-turn-helix protein [Gallibacterium anatis]|uniref:Uncharacterized protein conserved in bacteria, prophage-related n=1 Tax=Gallibacterium anatis TaxID=750 RepID=A0A0A2XXA3_9PAST|nr:YdaS family helix-turn-helix protein [Gallibacterium anatis]KGQ29754.1 hypothetical protein JP32_10535 [Gallibacterium anatis]KGQ55352.1 hypothetical protein IE01_08635 [Gallibacterium anatis DSM 16844 = F 149]STO37604.1 Uncharacterized protein conserved in bacteria, prophage-related [Gallibacterium anatis]